MTPPGVLPRPEFLIFGYQNGGKIRFYATRHVPSASFQAPGYQGNRDRDGVAYATWRLEAFLENLLVAEAGSWSEAFEAVATQFAKDAGDGKAPPAQEVWVRVLVRPEEESKA
jgi:hypothetical protein